MIPARQACPGRMVRCQWESVEGSCMRSTVTHPAEVRASLSSRTTRSLLDGRRLDCRRLIVHHHGESLGTNGAAQPPRMLEACRAAGPAPTVQALVLFSIPRRKQVGPVN